MVSNLEKGLKRIFCLRMKLIFIKRGVYIRTLGYRVIFLI